MSDIQTKDGWWDYLVRRSIFWFGFFIRPPIHWFVGLSSKVGNPPVFDNKVFPWAATNLEANWEAIRDEALKVMEHRENVPALRTISPDHDRIAVDNKWQSFFLYGYGHKAETNAAHCPASTAAIEQVPGLISAFFSIHAPGIHIPRHYGVTKGMITCHLALKVPTEWQKCRIDVDGKDYHWKEGQCFIFDDTYWHEVWNDTDEDRVILLIQFERPLGQPGKAISDGFMALAKRSPFIRTSVSRFREWEQKFADAASEKANKNKK